MANCSQEKRNYLLSIIAGLGGGLVSGMVMWSFDKIYSPNNEWASIIFIVALIVYAGLVLYAFFQLTGC